MTIEVCLQCIKLWEEIEKVHRDVEAPDRFRSKGLEAGVYSAKATYNLLCQGREEDCMQKLIWGSFAPLKCKFFVGLH
jgi:hypothetical protein